MGTNDVEVTLEKKSI